MAACESAERDAAGAGEDPGGALLDWFGVSVKAAEIPAHLQRMRTLARKVGLSSHPLPHPCIPAHPQRMRTLARKVCLLRTLFPHPLCAGARLTRGCVAPGTLHGNDGRLLVHRGCKRSP